MQAFPTIFELLAQTPSAPLDAGTKALILLAVTVGLLGLLAPFFIWVNVRGMRRENRRNLEKLQRSVEDLVEIQRRTNKLVERSEPNQRN